MPNWCENNITIYHDNEDVIKKIQEDMREDWSEEVDGETKTGTVWFSFSKLRAMPEELRNTESPNRIFATQKECDDYMKEYKDHPIISASAQTQEQVDALQKKYGATNWYDWAIENWGTKWQPNEVDMESDGNILNYAFDTPWSPPTPIYHALVEKYPEIAEDISWFYNEPGMQFSGYLNNEGS